LRTPKVCDPRFVAGAYTRDPSPAGAGSGDRSCRNRCRDDHANRVPKRIVRVGVSAMPRMSTTSKRSLKPAAQFWRMFLTMRTRCSTGASCSRRNPDVAPAVIVADAVDLVHEKGSPADHRRQLLADRLAEILDLDMRQFWEADASYWTRLSKGRPARAFAEAPGLISQSERSQEATSRLMPSSGRTNSPPRLARRSQGQAICPTAGYAGSCWEVRIDELGCCGRG
jgi:hypothetical protein